MERFTNDKIRFLNQIKVELFDFEDSANWITEFEYIEMPYFLNYAFSVNYSVNHAKNEFRLIQKNWNSEYDNSRFKLGIFNIDRLAISKEIIKTSKEENAKFNSIDKRKLETIDYEGIVLDGLICELKVPQIEKHLTWNVDKEMNDELSILVNQIRSKIYKE